MIVDLTDLVETMRTTFVTWSVNTIFAQTVATPGLQWLALPIISSIYRAILTKIVGMVSKEAAMQLFFMNTAIRKSTQSKDYVDAVRAKQGAKTYEEFEKAEQYEIQAFNNFVRLDR